MLESAIRGVKVGTYMSLKGFEHELCYWLRESACLLATMERQERTQSGEVLLHFVSKAIRHLRSLPLENLQYQYSLESVANLKITLCDVGIAMELHERLKSSVADRSRCHVKGRSSCTCFGRTVRHAFDRRKSTELGCN